MPEPLTAPQARIKAWLIDNYRHRHGETLPDIGIDEDIIEGRILDSLSMMNFIAFLEEIIEAEIPVETIEVENLRTLRRIFASYLASEAHPA